MQDEIILLLVEHQHAYEQHRNAEDGGVDYMIRIHRPAEKHAVPEHRDYRIERVRHERILCILVGYMQGLDIVEYGSRIEQQHAENFVHILDILEENLHGAKYHSNADAQHKEDEYRHERKQDIRSQAHGGVGEYHVIRHNDRKHKKRNQKRYEVRRDIRHGVYVLGHIHLLYDRCAVSYRAHGALGRLGIELIEQTAAEQIYGVVENLRLIASEDISEDEREHDHRQKRLKKCPEHTENRVPVLELNVLANDLGKKETVLIKILEVFLHPDHLHFFI